MHVSEVVKNFAVHGRKVFAFGFNYKLHAEELKHAVPTQPFYFLKPPSAYVTQVLQCFAKTVSEWGGGREKERERDRKRGRE